MNRRDFLFFRTERGTRVVEISCRRLALLDLEWRLTSRDATPSTIMDESDGEPPAVFDTPSVDQVFADLTRDLEPDDLLRVVDTAWTLSEGLQRRVSELVSAHSARGGRVAQV